MIDGRPEAERGGSPLLPGAGLSGCLLPAPPGCVRRSSNALQTWPAHEGNRTMPYGRAASRCLASRSGGGGGMNDKQFDRTLRSVGMECFVTYFRNFADLSSSNADVSDLLKQERRHYTMKSCRSRVSHARAIIEHRPQMHNNPQLMMPYCLPSFREWPFADSPVPVFRLSPTIPPPPVRPQSPSPASANSRQPTSLIPFYPPFGGGYTVSLSCYLSMAALTESCAKACATGEQRPADRGR